MKSFLYHLQINVSNAEISYPFYKDLLKYLEYEITEEGDWGFITTNKFHKNLADVIVQKTEGDYSSHKFHRKNPGLNHLAFGVSKKEDVDLFVKEFLLPRNIDALYNSPKSYPEYAEGYYAVFFEDPERVKLEIVYIPEFAEK